MKKNVVTTIQRKFANFTENLVAATGNSNADFPTTKQKSHPVIQIF